MKAVQAFLPVFICVMSCSDSSSQNDQSAGSLALFAKGFSKEVAISNCGDSRLFFTDQTGFIQVADSGACIMYASDGF